MPRRRLKNINDINAAKMQKRTFAAVNAYRHPKNINDCSAASP
jgi:hypothetical protein